MVEEIAYGDKTPVESKDTGTVATVAAEVWKPGSTDFPVTATGASDDPELVKMLADFKITEDVGLDPGDKSGDGTAKTLQALALKYHVNYRTEVVDGKTVYSFYAGSLGRLDDKPLLVTDKPIEEIDAQLHEIQQQKIKELEAKYGIEIVNPNNLVKLENGALTRDPNFDELMVLDEALKKSIPSVWSIDGQPLRIAFAATPSSSAGGYVLDEPDEPGKGALVVFEPGGKDPLGLYLHELAHVGQRNTRLQDPAAEQAYYASLGYTQVDRTNPETGEKDKVWALQGKDGKYYQQIGHQGYGQQVYWVQLDENGQPARYDLDENGKPFLIDGAATSGGNKVILTNEQMRELAVVKPVSEYFPYPWEVGAEAVGAFRRGQSFRSYLLTESPELYAQTKDFDQQEINAVFGVDAQGQPRYIRGIDGVVVVNNEENRQAVASWEAKIKAGQK